MTKRNTDEEDFDYEDDLETSDDNPQSSAKELLDEDALGLEEEIDTDVIDEIENGDAEEPDSTEGKSNENSSREEKRWQRLKRDREEKRILAQQVDYLAQKNAEMEYWLRKSIDKSSEQSNKEALTELERAENAYTAALESGDVQAVARANTLVARAMHNVYETEKRESVAVEPPSPTQFKETTNNLLYQWLDDNPELNSNSSEYDPDLQGKVYQYIKKVENTLRRNKKEHLISSPEYFNLLDQYIDSVDKSKSSKPSHIGRVTTNANVRRRGAGGVGGQILSNDEKEAAAAFNMTQKQYIELGKKNYFK